MWCGLCRSAGGFSARSRAWNGCCPFEGVLPRVRAPSLADLPAVDSCSESRENGGLQNARGCWRAQLGWYCKSRITHDPLSHPVSGSTLNLQPQALYRDLSHRALAGILGHRRLPGKTTYQHSRLIDVAVAEGLAQAMNS